MSKNLNEAAMAGNLEEVVFRLNLGEDVNQMSNKNSTALHDATTCGRVQIVKILIERWVITTQSWKGIKVRNFRIALLLLSWKSVKSSFDCMLLYNISRNSQSKSTRLLWTNTILLSINYLLQKLECGKLLSRNSLTNPEIWECFKSLPLSQGV